MRRALDGRSSNRLSVKDSAKCYNQTSPKALILFRSGYSMTSPQAIQQCFKMPTSRSITGRTSSITNAFVAAITPVIPPTVAQIAQVLNLLETHATDLRCAYCGDLATEWEHLRPLVKNSRPTGFLHRLKTLCLPVANAISPKGTQIGKFGCAAKQLDRHIAGIFSI